MTSPETRAAAVALYRDGHSLAVVGARLGVHLTTVAVWLRAAGVPRRRAGGRRIVEPAHVPAAARETAARRVLAKEPVATVARELGVRRDTVRAWVVEARPRIVEVWR